MSRRNISLTFKDLPPDLTPEKLAASLYGTPYFFLLESSIPGDSGRYSIAATDPAIILEVQEDSKDPFAILQAHLHDHSFENYPDLPFAGGWIGYFGYESYSFLGGKVPERRPDLIPKAVFCYYDSFYLYDHKEKQARIFSLDNKGRRFSGRTADRETAPTQTPNIEIESNFSRPAYVEAVRKIKDYITAGDCYQVNLSQRFTASTADPPFAIYQRLCKVSPAPYSAYLNLGDAQILSSSPECFLEVSGRQVVTRPIKGTRPRGATPEEDVGLKTELLASAKDRAELLMITDLERNDLGRVCRPGSISVPELRQIESFAQVHHLIATIRGELPPGRDSIDLLRAMLPGGSITGAPKIRAMQIIHELETHPRNVYCGAIGYFSLNGKAQFNVAIRTMILKDRKAHFWAGGGIVADSDPEAEYEETLAKARGMIEALDPANSCNFGMI